MGFFLHFLLPVSERSEESKKLFRYEIQKGGGGCGVEMKDQGSRIKNEEEEYEIERYLQIEGSGYGEYGV